MSVVDSDVFNIAERVRELDPSLRVVLHENHERPWVVVERCADGEERFVARYAELDARVVDDLRYMLAVPFDQRLAKVAREAEESNERLGRMTDEQFDRFAWDFKRSLYEANMADFKWGRSYRPKVTK